MGQAGVTYRMAGSGGDMPLPAGEELIATIYEAALLPERWARLPALIARRLGATSGILYHRDALGAPSGEGMPAVAEETRTSVAIGTPGSREWVLRLDRFDNRDRAAAARRMLVQLAPHLARATAIVEQQVLHEAQLTVAALDRIGSGAAVIDDTGRVLAANARFVGQVGALIPVGSGLPMRLGTRRGDASLRTTLAEAIVGGQRGAVPIHDEAGHCVAALHLLPVDDEARHGRGATVLALVAQPGGDALPEAALLQSLFGLTGAEAKLARGVAAGRTLEMMAQAGGITLGTARSHIKRVFSKTGTTRQLDLTLLIRGFGVASVAEEKLAA